MKIHELLERRGVVVPLRTVQRYVLEVCGRSRGRGPTVRVADGEPGDELQVDFGRMGFLVDADDGPAAGGAGVDLHGLLLAALLRVVDASARRPSDVIDGFEAAWGFFGGVFATVIPDNLSAVVDDADPLEPRLNQAFVEYAQARGFRVDPARVRRPQDKPRVERTVPFVRNSFFAGETFVDLADAQRRAEAWCRERAGHADPWHHPVPPGRGVRRRGAAAAAAGADGASTTCRSTPRRRCIGIITSRSPRRSTRCPGNLIGTRVEVRADRQLVRIFHRGQLVKVHPRQQPGRPLDRPRRPARGTRPCTRCATSIGCDGWPPATARRSAPTPTALLDIPLPWTKMRQVYALLGLVKKWGAERVDAACARALGGRSGQRRADRPDARARHRSTPSIQPALPGTVVAGRFARDPAHFAVSGSKRPHPDTTPSSLRPSEAILEPGFAADLAGAAR